MRSKGCGGAPGARHAEAGLQQRLVVGLAVVSDEHVELRQVLGQPPEQGSLFAVIAHEELAQAETGWLDGADADQESVGSGAARQARGLGIQEGPPRGRRAGDRRGRKRPQQISGNSVRPEISTLPWRRWRSQSFPVSKCSPWAVRTTSPLMSSSMK